MGTVYVPHRLADSELVGAPIIIVARTFRKLSTLSEGRITRFTVQSALFLSRNARDLMKHNGTKRHLKRVAEAESSSRSA